MELYGNHELCELRDSAVTPYLDVLLHQQLVLRKNYT